MPLRVLVRIAGLLVLCGGIWLALARFEPADGAWLLCFACCTLGLVAASTVLAQWRQGGRPPRARPLVQVAIDRTVSQVPLSVAGFTHEPHGYGLLEQWIPRLGHFTYRAEGAETFAGDVLLVISPTGSVRESYRRRLVEFVAGGGKLMVFDSPDSVGTTANSLLWPFDMAVYHATTARGELRMEEPWPGLALQATCAVVGGDPFMWVGETPVAARTHHGKGTVTAIGFGSLMNNESMGGHWMAEPSDRERLVYEVLYELIDSAVDDRPVAPRGIPKDAAPEGAENSSPGGGGTKKSAAVPAAPG